MRRIERICRSNAVLSSSIRTTRAPAHLTCDFCQRLTPQRAAAFSTCHVRTEPDFLERTRRRIWGTDNPPGADDPYTGQSRPRRGRRHEQDDEVLTIGGDEAQADADARLYEQQALREARELYQQSVDVAPEHDDYQPANTWDGLEMVGGEKDWDSGEAFYPFKSSKQLESPEEITMAIHRAAVEVLVAASADESLTDLADPEESASLASPTKEVRIRADGDRVKLEFPNEDVIRRVVSSIRGQPEAEEPLDNEQAVDESQATASIKKDVQRLGREWLHIPLTDSRIKFAIVRRIIQLTGLHVPDHLISEARSLSFLVAYLTKPKPQSLADELQKGPLSQLANVRLLHRRETPIDKEKRTGRWKVIEEELVRRDLPVVGRW